MARRRVRDGSVEKMKQLFLEPMELVTVKEAAGLLRIPLPTVYYIVQRGILESFKVGGQWRLHRGKVEAYGEQLKGGQSGMSVKDVADRLHVPLPTVYAYLRSGRLPAVRVGGRWRIDEDDILNLVSIARS